MRYLGLEERESENEEKGREGGGTDTVARGSCARARPDNATQKSSSILASTQGTHGTSR